MLYHIASHYHCSFTLNYMMTLLKDAYLLPMIKVFVLYEQKISKEIKQEELEMIVDHIKRKNRNQRKYSHEKRTMKII